MSFFDHERDHRGKSAMDALATSKVVICGAGAIGANLAEGLVRVGVRQITVIDFDRIEERNLSTQPWGRRELGQRKARMLGNRLHRDLGVELVAVCDRLHAENSVEMLSGYDLIIDAFDNSASRKAAQDGARTLAIPCVHAGMADGYGEVVWDEVYRVPEGVHEDLCDYPLARALVTLVVGAALEVCVQFLTEGVRRHAQVTLRDLCMRSDAENHSTS